jgi:hypothetical protein
VLVVRVPSISPAANYALNLRRHPYSLVEQRALNEVNHIFRFYQIQHVESNVITIHVGNYKTWTSNDVVDPRICVKLLWDDDEPTANPTLDAVQSKLDKKRVLSDVGVFSSVVYSTKSPNSFSLTARSIGQLML